MSFCGILAAGVILTLAQAQSVDAIKAQAMERRSHSDSTEQRFLECVLSDSLHDALDAWIQEKGPTQVEACEQVINRLITEGKPSVEAYFLAAKVSELIGEPGEAVTILRKVLEVHPDGWTPGVPIPIAVSANMWLGRLYKEGGEADAADDAFSAAAAAAAGAPEEGPRTLCNLYLAEVQADLLGEEDEAKETLASVAEAKSSVARGGLDGVAILAEWAKHKLGVMNGASRGTLGCSPDYVLLIPILVSQQLDLVGVLNEPRVDFYNGVRNSRRRLFGLSAEAALKTARGDMDRDALRLILGAVWMDAKEYAKAEAVLLELREANSFLSPVAGLDLARCQFAQGKQDQAAATLDAVKQQWPSYEKTVEECRKSAASPAAPPIEPEEDAPPGLDSEKEAPATSENAEAGAPSGGRLLATEAQLKVIQEIAALSETPGLTWEEAMANSAPVLKDGSELNTRNLPRSDEVGDLLSAYLEWTPESGRLDQENPFRAKLLVWGSALTPIVETVYGPSGQALPLPLIWILGEIGDPLAFDILLREYLARPSARTAISLGGCLGSLSMSRLFAAPFTAETTRTVLKDIYGDKWDAVKDLSADALKDDLSNDLEAIRSNCRRRSVPQFG